MKIIRFLLLLTTACLYGQSGGGTPNPVVPGSPTIGASCVSGSPFYANVVTGVMASCQYNGTVWAWTNIAGTAGNTTNALTFNASGSGASSGATFNGSVARIVSYNTIGAQAALGYNPENVANKGQANGYAGLNALSLIAVSFLPVATVGTNGVVQPDGSTITINNGVISSVSSGSPPNTYNVSSYANLNAAITAVNATGGTLYVGPGSYSVTSSATVGTSSNIVNIVFYGYPTISCAVGSSTNHADCLRYSNKSGYSGSAFFTVASGAYVHALITNAKHDGSQQYMFMGDTIISQTTGTGNIDIAAVNLVGLNQVTKGQNLNCYQLYGYPEQGGTPTSSVACLLLETPGGGSGNYVLNQGSNGSHLPSVVVTLSGTTTTTVTYTAPTGWVNPDVSHVSQDETLVVSNCTGQTGTSPNGTYTYGTGSGYFQITGPASITLTTSGTNSGTVTGCKFTLDTVSNIQNGVVFDSVYANVNNNPASSSSKVGGVPWMMFTANGGLMGNVWVNHLSLEGACYVAGGVQCNTTTSSPDYSFVNLQNDGTGATGSNQSYGHHFQDIHCEPYNGDNGTPVCMLMQDTVATIDNINGAGCSAPCTSSSTLVEILSNNVTMPNGVIVNMAETTNWTNSVVDNTTGGSTVAGPTSRYCSGSSINCTAGSAGALTGTLALSLTNSAVTLTAGANCSTGANSCNDQWNNTSYSFTSSSNATISGTTLTPVYVYQIAGSIYYGYSGANSEVVTCTSGTCTAVSGITAYPANSLHLGTASATSGVWATPSNAVPFASQNIYTGSSGVVVSSNSIYSDQTVYAGYGYTTPISALSTAIACDGSTDDGPAFAAIPAGTTVRLPDNATCIFGTFTNSNNNVKIKLGKNTVMKEKSGNTGIAMTFSGTNGDVEGEDLGSVIDTNGNNSNAYTIYFSNQSGTVRNLSFKNSSPPGSPSSSNVTNGVKIFNGSALLENLSFQSSFYGQSILVDLHSSTSNSALIRNIQSTGSLVEGIQVENSNGGTGVENTNGSCEISGSNVQNVGDIAADSGLTGNAYSAYLMGPCDIHDNKSYNTAYSGVRVTSSNGVKVHHNDIQYAGETAIYCPELGGYGDECDDNNVWHSQQGINNTNTASAYTPLPSVITNNHLTDIAGIGIFCGNANCSGNTLDGVPIPISVGSGGTGLSAHDNVVIGNKSHGYTNSAYAKAIGPVVFVDTATTFGTDKISGNSAVGWTGILDPSQMTITGGSGYTSAPSCAVSGGTYTVQATCAVTISGGAVNSISFPIVGSYTVAPTIALTGGGGSSGAVSIGSLVSGGYLSGDLYTISNGSAYVVGTGITVTNSSTMSVNITNTSAPSSGQKGCFININRFGATAPGTSGAPALTNPMAALNGVCGTVGTVTGSSGNYTFPVTLDTNYPANTGWSWSGPNGSQKTKFYVFQASGGAPVYSWPSAHDLITDEQIYCSATPGTNTVKGSSWYEPDGTRSSSACSGTGTLVTNIGGTLYYN
jgi:hypothetical protein